MARTKKKRKDRSGKTRKNYYRYRCRGRCRRRFNNKKNGVCPNCGSKNIQLLGIRSATQAANKAR